MSALGLHSEEPQTFHGRYLRWLHVLDPTTLLASDEEIRNAEAVVASLGETTEDPAQNWKVKEALKTCLGSLHPDTGSIISMMFRPPAFMPFATPLVIATLLPHRGAKSAFFWQILFQSYSAGFNLQNRNETFQKEKVPSYHSLLLAGLVTYAACVGATPQYIMNRYKLTSPAIRMFFGKVLPAPLLAALSAFNVIAVRVHEIEHGIHVVDKTGKVVGVSHRAAEKAVKETAMSRAALVGVTAAVPIALEPLLLGSRFLLGSRLVVTPVKYVASALVFGALIPASFSLFPQKGTIARTDLETELRDSTAEAELYYHRGL